MPWTRERESPWSARSRGVSPTRESLIAPPSTLAVTPPSGGREGSPLGPLTLTTAPSAVAVTPCGMATGILPMRDMGASPDLAEDLAADAGGARLAVREHAPARRDDGDAEPVEHLGDRGDAAVLAAAGPRDAADPGDDGVAVRVVLQVDPQQRPRPALLGDAKVLDVALAAQDLGDGAHEARRGDVDGRLPHADRVADAGEQVGDRVGHRHGRPPTTTPCERRGSAPGAPCSGSRGGTRRTCGSTRGGGRRTGSGCSGASGTSACAAA